MNGWRRLAAYGIDWCVFACWGGAVFAAAFYLQDGELAAPASPWLRSADRLCVLDPAVRALLHPDGRIQLAGDARQAPPGAARRRASTAGDPRRRTTLGRAAVKLVPWELGHIVPHQMVAAGRGREPAALAVRTHGALAIRRGVVRAVPLVAQRPYSVRPVRRHARGARLALRQAAAQDFLEERVVLDGQHVVLDADHVVALLDLLHADDLARYRRARPGRARRGSSRARRRAAAAAYGWQDRWWRRPSRCRAARRPSHPPR